jgi:putative FmdB family regulatory protein
MPIYEFKCGLCGEVYEKLTLRVDDSLTSLCPFCQGKGTKCISAPAIIVGMFDPKATHRLPDWHQKQAQAEAHDRQVRRRLKLPPPLAHDKGAGIKVYQTEFGKSERSKLDSLAQLDNR